MLYISSFSTQIRSKILNSIAIISDREHLEGLADSIGEKKESEKKKRGI